MKIILASTSRYRAQQLRNMGLSFGTCAPQFDEEAYKAKSRLAPRLLSQRLASEKARSVYLNRIKSQPASKTDLVVIGADQLVCLGKTVLGKPHSSKNAVKMLTKMQGRKHQLITSICVMGPNNKTFEYTDIVEIKMRALTGDQIRQYIDRDRPFDCAGSYRFEKGGLTLVQSLKIQDPSSLIGLPLIALTDILLRFGSIPFRKGAK